MLVGQVKIGETDTDTGRFFRERYSHSPEVAFLRGGIFNSRIF